MFFTRIRRGGRIEAPILSDLEESVSPLASDEGPVQVRKGGLLRVRSSVRAGGNAGEGTDQTDRSN
jgi:hypothetical protein